jgi:hypothetical protein
VRVALGQFSGHGVPLQFGCNRLFYETVAFAAHAVQNYYMFI